MTARKKKKNIKITNQSLQWVTDVSLHFPFLQILSNKSTNIIFIYFVTINYLCNLFSVIVKYPSAIHLQHTNKF